MGRKSGSLQCLFFCLICLLCVPQAGSATPGTVVSAPAAHGALPARADFAFAEPYFETLGQGKSPSSVITALLQDAQGWLWIGTQVGLFRYDGYRMRKFAHDAGNPEALAGDYVTTLWQAGDGRLWVGTFSDGISIFDPKTEQFSHLRHDPARATSLAGGSVWALAGDGKGGVWIGTNQGLDYVKSDGTSPDAPLRHYRHEPNNPASLLNNRIRSLLFDKQGRLWVGSAGGLQRYQAAGPGKPAGFVRVASNTGNPTSLAGKFIFTLFQAQDGKLWLGTREHGAAWLNLAEPEPNPHWLPVGSQRADHLSHAWVGRIIEPQAGQIWIATFGGIDIVAAQDGTVLQRLRHDPANASSLAHNANLALMQDHSGTLWLGSWGGGLQRHHPAQVAFKVLRYRPGLARPDQAWPGSPAGLSHPEVRSVLELADGRILVGTGGNGIDILDRRQGVVGGYRPHQPGGLADGTILTMLQTPDGTLWAGSQQAGVLRLPSGSSHWQGFASAEGLPSVHVRQLLLEPSGGLWAATTNGIARWHADSQRFVAQQQLDGSALQVSVIALAQDRQGQLWAASNHGLWLKTPRASGWQAIRHQPGQPGSLPSDDVIGLWVDASDRLWVNTRKGLVRLQKRDGRTTVFEAISTTAGQQGLARYDVTWQDQQGRIWGKTAILSQTGPGTVHFADNHRPELGTEWFGANSLTRDGLFMYAGSQGLAIFDPAKFSPWTFQPPVRLTELKINGKATPSGALLPRLRLTPDQRNFSVEFAALDLSQAEQSKTRYRYQLQGYDKDWINTDSEHRVASYGNLWPGHYTLHVQGSNREGEWSVQALSIPIQVLPAWWQTWWFALVLLLLISSLLAALDQIRTRYLRQRQRVLEQVVNDRTHALRQKQVELVDSNNELKVSNNALNEANDALNEANAELRRAQGQLVQQEKMASLGGLVAGIAHEINTPLGTTVMAISGVGAALQTLQESIASGRISKSVLDASTSEGLEYNALALKTATRAAELIALFKTISVNADSDRVAEIELADYLPEVATLVHTQMVKNGSKLELAVPAGLRMQVVQDALTESLSRILVNVINHAFTDGRTGTLRLAAQMEEADGGNEVVISVSDDGHGIAPQDLPKVFDPFFTTKSGMHGHVGLGLHVAYNHVTQRLKGKIQVTSTLGAGTCVEIRLKSMASHRANKT